MVLWGWITGLNFGQMKLFFLAQPFSMKVLIQAFVEYST